MTPGGVIIKHNRNNMIRRIALVVDMGLAAGWEAPFRMVPFFWTERIGKRGKVEQTFLHMNQTMQCRMGDSIETLKRVIAKESAATDVRLTINVAILANDVGEKEDRIELRAMLEEPLQVGDKTVRLYPSWVKSYENFPSAELWKKAHLTLLPEWTEEEKAEVAEGEWRDALRRQEMADMCVSPDF